MAKGIVKSLVSGIVESGTGIIVGQVIKSLTDSFVPKKSGVTGLFQDICIGAARFAVTYKAIDTMGEYVEQKYDKTASTCKKIVKAFDDIRNPENDIEEVTDNGKESEPVIKYDTEASGN